MSKKKFFSGNSLRQALLSAAAHFDLPPDDIAYREVEKKHGFLKTRKRVVIEVDAEDPRRPPDAPEAAAAEERPGEPLERGEAAESGAAELDVDPSRGRPPRLPRGEGEEHWGGAGDRTRPARGRRRDEGEEEPAAEPAAVAEPEPTTPDADAEERAAAAPARRRGRRGRGAAADEEPARPAGRRTAEEPEAEEEPEAVGEAWEAGEEEGEEPAAAAARPAAEETGDEAGDEAGDGRRRRRRRRGGRGRGPGAEPAAGAEADDEDLVSLPERPRRPSERFAEARGPLADATREALDRVLDVAGLELGYTVLQGDDRLEIDLTGSDESLLVAEGGELLRAIEHLVPRMVRTLSGEPVSVRVDAADFHEIHEEQLRTLAQRVASEVRRSERPRKLEPMSPADRRIVHITLADEPRVTSMSEGTGYFKRIVVKPA